LANIALQFAPTACRVSFTEVLPDLDARRLGKQPRCRYCWSASYNVFLWQIRQNQKMNAIFPIFTCLALAGFSQHVWAQSPRPLANPPIPTGPRPPAIAASDSNTGNAMLRRAMVAVDAERSVAAKVRQKIELLDRQMVGAGVYLQQGRGPARQLRLELKLQSGDTTSSLLQICDGTTLWIHEDLTDRKNLSRVDVARLRNARPKSPAPPVDSSLWLALGGLSKLLWSLENSFQFAPPTEGRLDTLRVWTLEGRWKPERLVQLLPDQKANLEAGKPIDPRSLTPNLPERVVLHLGCDDLFPYRLEYWRSETSDKNKPPGRPRLMVVLELFEVQLGGAIDPRQFAYKPGDLQPTDRTQSLLDKFGLEEVAPSGANRNLAPRR
jgi:hypothetical protein